jgi:Inner membrane component of T3SS, cytoplasmic domain/GAF domain
MPARLTVYLADRPARVLVLREEEEYVLGRDATSTLVVDDDRVSRRHARLRRGREGWELSDLASKNGTLVNGQPVAGRALLAHRGWLSLGGVLASFEPLTEEQSRAEISAESERRRSTVAARRRLAAADSLDAILQGLLESVVQLSGAERGFVLLARGDGDLAVAAASGLAAFDLGAAEFSGSIGAVERALATGRAVAVADALADPALGGRESVARGGIRALVCMPLSPPPPPPPTAAAAPAAPAVPADGGAPVDRRSLGVLYADSSAPGSAFTELDAEILEALASQAALAIAAARLDEEVERLLADVEAVSGRSPVLWSELLATHAAAASGMAPSP